MVEDVLQNISSKIIGYALEKGVSEAEFYGRCDDVLQVEIKSSGVGKIVSRTMCRYALRIAIGKRVGLVYSENIDPGSINDLVDKAYSITMNVPEDSSWPGFSRGYSGYGAVKTYDEGLASISPEELVGFIGELIDRSIEAALEAGASDASITRGYLWVIRSYIYIENSYGDSIGSRSTGFSTYYNIYVRRNGGETAYPVMIQLRKLDREYIVSRSLEDARAAVRFIGARPIDSGEYQVLLMPEAHGELVDTVFSPAVSAYNIQRNRSPLKDKVGQRIMSEDVTILDDPHMDYGFGSRSFDDEGLMTTSKPLVEDGILKNIVYDHYTASIEGRRSTGNAVRRRLYQAPYPAPLNIVFKPRSKMGLDEMIGMIRRGIIIYRLIGSWMSNPVNGSVQATVTHGFYVENGEIKYPVKGVVIGGNYYDYLGGKLLALGDMVINYGSIYAVPVLIDKVSVAGK